MAIEGVHTHVQTHTHYTCINYATMQTIRKYGKVALPESTNKPLQSVSFFVERHDDNTTHHHELN